MRFERKRGCNLAESFEGIWEFIARTNILVPPPASSRRNVMPKLKLTEMSKKNLEILKCKVYLSYRQAGFTFYTN